MRVGFITYGLDRPLTGIGRYTLEMAQTYEKMQGQMDVVLLKAGELGPLAATPLPQVKLVGCRLLPGLLTIGHELIPILARQLGLDVLHDPTAVTPLLFGAGGAAVVSTVHDVIPWSYPGNSALLDELIYKRWLPLKLPHIDAIITVSQHSKQEIVRYMRLPPEKIHVIYYGVREVFRPVENAAAHVKARFQVDQPYILYVGNLTQRKNVELALRAFANLHERFPDLRFVLAGPSTFKQTNVGQIAEELHVSDKIILPGSVNDQDLPALYSAAEIFVFPSLYEGFGLPVVEAMACGTVVITSTASSLPEVAGEAALLVDPRSVDQMTDALQTLLKDASLRADLRQRGLARAAQFSWDETVRQTWQIYETIRH